jgi:hypothetical protein
MESEYLTVDETALRARISAKTIYNLISLRKLGRDQGICHFGRRVLINWPVFEARVLRGE